MNLDLFVQQLVNDDLFYYLKYLMMEQNPFYRFGNEYIYMFPIEAKKKN
jgi:hypothetical protein